MNVTKNNSIPKISIIIPVYNSARYLQKCLDSVTNQSLHDIEIICINDGSTDESLAIIQQYAYKDIRIKVYTQENIGVGYSRNLGINLACGEFVIFMDPDDYYPDDRVLQTLYNKAVEHNAVICGGSFSSFNQDISFSSYEGTLTGYTFEHEGIIEYCDYQFDYGFQRFIYSRNMLIEHDLKFPLYKRYQDPPFFVNSMMAAKRFYSIPDIVYCYQDKMTLWDSHKVMDLMKGLIDVLKLSSIHSYSKLHVNTYRRITTDYIAPIANYYDRHNRVFWDLVDELENAIDFRLFEMEKEEYKAIKDLIIDVLHSECDNLKSDLEYYKSECNNLKSDSEYYKMELSLTKSSWTYKIGRLTTYFPRVIRNLIDKII